MRIIMAGGLFLILIVAGCGIPYQGSWYTDTLLLTRYETNIEHSKTTEQEIREWFGEPWVVTTDLKERKQYIYLFGYTGERARMDVVFKDGLVYDHQIMREGARGEDRDDGRIIRPPRQ